jgi:CheY-like chemotaxis protein
LQDSLLDPVAAPDTAPDVVLRPHRAAARGRLTVVDDSTEFLSLIEDVLGTTHDVVTQQVVRAIDDLAATAPDLLVVDLHCGGPEGGLTGWEIIAAARAHPALRNVPVLVCSADLAALREDRISLIAYGDVQIVAKPFDVAAFEQLVAQTLRLAGGPRLRPLEDSDYPRLDAVPMSFREGRPLRMCAHGRVRDQGDYCSRCGW